MSAQNPDGLAPSDYYPFFDRVVRSRKVISMDVAEMCPRRDREGITAKLTARLINQLIRLRNEPRSFLGRLFS